MASNHPLPLSSAGARSLRHVRAAQLRARGTKQAIIQMLLGTVFLVGALSYARAPDRHAQVNLAWMAGLLVLSTLDGALGLRALVRFRLRRKFGGVGMAPTPAWGLISVVLV